MTIEVGQIWRRRDGQLVEVVADVGATYVPRQAAWRVQEATLGYVVDGDGRVDDREFAHDLTELVCPAPTLPPTIGVLSFDETPLTPDYAKQLWVAVYMAQFKPSPDYDEQHIANTALSAFREAFPS